MASKEEDRYLMLSGIQHFQFCRRQWALIHIEQQWAENVKTVEGQHLHRNADQPFTREKRGKKLIVRGMPVKSQTLAMSGICDVVEFVQDDDGVEIFGEDGLYSAYPVEYKRGKPKKNDADIVQLVAQAICLEEMMLCEVDKGYVYYNEVKSRIDVSITQMQKDTVRAIAKEMHAYYDKRHTPKVKTGPFCKKCSLQHICMPSLMKKRSVKSYIEEKVKE